VEWLLSAADINTAMGATGMTVATTDTKISNDGTDVTPKNCLALYGPAELRVYAVSNWSAVRRQSVQEPNDDPAHMVNQTVVSFPSANDVGAFFSRSAQEWPDCANHQFMHRDLRHNDETLVTGAVTNTNGVLSVSNIQQRTHGWGCQRALTVANNVAIDIAACSYTRSDAAINIADGIAAKVRAAR
jgi:PknH-like extracellular domain